MMDTFGDEGNICPEGYVTEEIHDEMVTEKDVKIAQLMLLLTEHHLHHMRKGTIGLPDGSGGWVEIDNGAEYSDSALYKRTVASLASTEAIPAVCPKRTGDGE
ncbi:hypothetical protein LCGC14_0231380 [marine sediment metagenome]|uniref:Uncharacterized protein n=1 Tax=marine sediment metagenome TaxID=412755 RepID=A0A0F9WUJ8_9ZZZZ